VDEKPALTQYRVVSSRLSYPSFSVVEFILVSGRKHQLRVHAQEGLKTPIVMDKKYTSRNKKNASFEISRLVNCDRLMLHCKSIMLPNFSKYAPKIWKKEVNAEDRYVEINIGLPKEFKNAINLISEEME
jgi:23S rRNA-/tRNA-specific pseudouridylate synthase